MIALTWLINSASTSSEIGGRAIYDISRDSPNSQPLVFFFYSRAGYARLLIVNHREHGGAAEQLAHLWTLSAWKVSDALDFGREVTRFCHFNQGAA